MKMGYKVYGLLIASLLSIGTRSTYTASYSELFGVGSSIKARVQDLENKLNAHLKAIRQTVDAGKEDAFLAQAKDVVLAAISYGANTPVGQYVGPYPIAGTDSIDGPLEYIAKAPLIPKDGSVARNLRSLGSALGITKATDRITIAQALELIQDKIITEDDQRDIKVLKILLAPSEAAYQAATGLTSIFYKLHLAEQQAIRAARFVGGLTMPQSSTRKVTDVALKSFTTKTGDPRFFCQQCSLLADGGQLARYYTDFIAHVAMAACSGFFCVQGHPQAFHKATGRLKDPLSSDKTGNLALRKGEFVYCDAF